MALSPGRNEGAKILPVFRLSTWNTRTLHGMDKTELLLKEKDRMKIDILSVTETHWTMDKPTIWESGKYVIIQSPNQDGVHRQGVAIILKKQLAESLVDYQTISSRLLKTTLELGSSNVNIFTVYAPDCNYDDQQYEEFLDQLQNEINKIPVNEEFVIMGDFNAVVGNDITEDWPEVIGKFGFGNHNPRELNLLQFCAINNLIIANTIFKHNEKRKYTCTSPDFKTKKQIDYIVFQSKWKPKLKNCRSYHSAEIGSDHSLVLANLEISRSKRVRYAPRKIPKGYDIEKLRRPDVANRYEVEIGGRFSALLEERQPQELYDNFKRIIHSVAKQEIGLKQHKQLENLSWEVINLCERRRKAKINLLNHPDDAEKQIEYRKLNKTVKKLIQKQKRENLQNKIMTLEEDFAKNNTHNLFRSVRELEGKKQKSYMVLKDSQGVIRMKKQEVLTIWQTHFEKHLNTQFPHDEDALSEFSTKL